MKKIIKLIISIIVFMIGLYIIHQSLDTSNPIPWPRKELSSIFYIISGGFITLIGAMISPYYDQFSNIDTIKNESNISRNV